jgi:hypothetical protein
MYDALTEKGTVIVRDGEMVIDIPVDGKTVYLIIGKSRDHFYEGANSARNESPRVHAKWINFGPLFGGRWFEDGEEYLFCFRLPAAGEA